MSLETRNREFALRIAQLFNQAAAQRGDLSTLQTGPKTSLVNAVNDLVETLSSTRASVGALNALETADKNNLVAALNEIKATVDAATNINDDAVTASTTYSSTKIVGLIQSAVANILDGAPEALDTLKEVAAELGNQDSAMQTLLANQANRVRFDAAQTLTAEQALQARQNIQAVGTDDIGNFDLDLVNELNTALSALANQ